MKLLIYCSFLFVFLIAGCSNATEKNIAEPVWDEEWNTTSTIETGKEPQRNRGLGIILKQQQEVSFEELDEVEQHAVGFIQEYFNVPEGETEEAFYERLSEYIGLDLEVGVRIPVLPETRKRIPMELGFRELQEVFLLPEYMDIPGWHYVVPTVIRYRDHEKEYETVVYWSWAYEDGEITYLLGHTSKDEVYDFVMEMTKKYELDQMKESQ